MTHRHNHPGPFTLRLESLESRRLLSAGALDPSFSVDGKATFAFGGGVSVIANDVAVQGDGKTLVVGETISGKHFAVARFNLDGTPDTSFGGGTGRVLTHFGGSNDYSGANAVVIQPDGKIVVAGGTAGNITVHYNFAVARYNSDGSLDKTFDGDGKTSISFGVFSGAQAHAVALQRDGKIVLAGYDFGELSSEKDFAVARLHANGSPDLTFNLSGKRIIGLGGQDEANAVAIDYSGTQATNPYFGSILVGGESIRNSGNTGRFAAVRLNIVGGFINSFDGDGKLSTIVGNRARAYAKDLIIQNDGKFILAGSASSSSATESDVALVRYNANGTLDSTFGSGDSGTGQVLVDFGGSEQANGIVRNYDGSGLLVAGTFSGQFGVTLLNNNGSLDTTFGTNGLVRTNLGGSSGASGIARGPGRRFLLTGGGSFSTARYFETGANLVYATVLDFAKTATETAVKPASFFVHRLERLSVATRVYFAVGGTARYPGGLLASARDYNLDGMTSPALEIGTPYVDIPANQTFAAVYLNPKDDARLEPNETAIFRILSNAAYEVGTPSSVTLNI
ncbi:MAG: delta-60 repeat domain-containing protein, partial [Tepidisphaeraceae bacterium]